jgi:hypothetical protein
VLVCDRQLSPMLRHFSSWLSLCKHFTLRDSVSDTREPNARTDAESNAKPNARTDAKTNAKSDAKSDELTDAFPDAFSDTHTDDAHTSS